MNMLDVPAVPADAVAWITEADMVEVDRVMIDELHIESIQMMEHAGRNLARLVLDAASPATVSLPLDRAATAGVGSSPHVTAGTAPGAVVTADATMTLALPKLGLRGSAHVGELYVADISVPPAVTAPFGAAPPPFGKHGLVRLIDET